MGEEVLYTKKEKNVLDLLATGKMDTEIAEELGLSTNTIKTHVKNIYKKLGVRNRVEAAIKHRIDNAK